MLSKLKQVAGFLNLPVMVLVMLAVLIVCGMSFLVKKLASRSSKKHSKSIVIVSKDKEESLKLPNRKKRSKKQRSVEIGSQQKQTSADKPLVSTHIKNEKPTVVKNTRETIVEKKKDKKKTKSKKKQVQNEDVITTTPAVIQESVVEDVSGEWQTVRNKEQRTQRKEKKRQDETATTLPKPNPIITHIPPVTSLPSTAKDVAPRFARAAGEDWPEGASKRQMSASVTKSTTIVNRSPMLPAAALHQQEPASNWQTTTTSTIPDVWEKTDVSTTIGFSSAQNITWSSSKPNVPAWNLEAATWPNGGVPKPWDNSGNGVEKSDWSGESKSDDWVRVSTPSPTIASTTEPWTTTPDIYTQADWTDTLPASVNETFQLEPEGLAVSTSPPDDPWNTETFVKGGDWSPPEAHWSNTNEEWKVSISPTKPEPIYFNESSDDEKPNSVVNVSNPSVPHSIVGAGSDFLSSQNPNNKKTRRRRKKKLPSDNVEVTSKETIVSSIPVGRLQQIQVISPKEALPDASAAISNTEEAWSLTKSSKKKKVRARKAE